MEIEPIGVIRSPFRTKAECPIQPTFADEARGWVEVLPEYAAGLQDIELFSHIFLIYAFDRAGEVELVRAPFLDDTPHGVFASRHPCRPSGIGLSIVRLESREDNLLIVRGLDVLDATPLLDIKPYVHRFDAIDSASDGWVADRPWRGKPPDRE